MNILFAGEGGQGVQVIAEILSQAAFLEGKDVLYIPNFGVEQRGGVSLAFVVIDNKTVVYPKFATADYVVILSDRSIARLNSLIKPDKTQQLLGPAISDGTKTSFPPQAWNILMLGKLNNLSKVVKTESLLKAIETRFKLQFLKNPALRELDLKALNNAQI